MRRVILAFAAVAPVLTILVWSKSIPLAIGILFISHMLLLYPTLRPTSQWLGPVATSFETTRKEVWLTIDDGPDAEDTPRILDLLDLQGGRATFFVKGSAVARRPDLAAEIVRRGHSLGNHSMTHPSGTFWCLPPAAIANQIDRCSESVQKATGVHTTLFRAPVGMKNPFVHPLLARRAMQLIGWSARGFDGVRTDCDSIVAAILRGTGPGSIVLVHEGRHDSLGKAINYEVIERLIERLDADGYSLVIPNVERLIYGRRNTNR